MLPASTTHSPIPVNLNRAQLAFELATGLTTIPDVLARFRLTKHQLKTLLRNDPQFRHQINEYKREWHSPKNAKERIRFKAQLAAEDGLLDLYAIFKDADIGTQQRLEAYKQIVNLADVAPKKDVADTGSRFSITINLGDTEQDRLTISADTTPTEEISNGEETGVFV